MSERTLREVLRDAIDRVGEPTLALFTTFNFDPVFFEDYVLPVFCEGLDATTMSGVLAADRFLRSMATVVFHDADQLAQGRKRLSYGTVPVRPEAHNFFHPKLIVLGNDDGEFLLIVGSANLTVSGWGRNHEVITTPVDVPAKSYVSLTLFRTLEWLRDYAQAQLRGVDGEAVWYQKLDRAVSELETHRRRSKDDRFLLSSLSEAYDGGVVENLASYAELVDARRLTVYSPYFSSNLSNLVASLRSKIGRPSLQVRLVPALEMTRDGQLRVGICDAERDVDREYEIRRVRGDHGQRFRHAKLFWVEGTKRRHVVMAGSHNFTRPALALDLEGHAPNVEASLAVALGEKETLALLGDLADLELLDLDAVVLKTREELEEEAPRVSRFSCSVVADWRKREYRVVGQPTHASLLIELPGLSEDTHVVAGEPTIVAFTDQVDKALRRRKFFRAWLDGQLDEPVVGLVCELGWERFRVDAVGTNLADYLDVWRAGDHDDLVDRSSRKMLRSLVENGDGENERDAVEVIASRLERQEHLDTLYGMLGGFIELARHVDQAQSAAAVDELLWCGPHSLANFVQLLEDTADEVLSPIRRWVLYTEAQQLIARPTSVRATDGVAERLYELCQRLRECCRRIEESTVLRDIDRAHIDDTTPLFEWFRRQLGLEFERMWEADE